jgi:hypothetical protein
LSSARLLHGALARNIQRRYRRLSAHAEKEDHHPLSLRRWRIASEDVQDARLIVLRRVYDVEDFAVRFSNQPS